MSDNGPTTIQTYLELHQKTSVRFDWGLVSGSSNLKKLIESARVLAEADALIAFEGNNEPNNWGVTYQGEKGGGQAPSWMAVAKLQRDLYQAVKSDPILKKYPVWSISENGAERDNVGLQFLTIPNGAATLMPEGTQYADFANVHNYIYHPSSSGLMDNKTWNAADPTPACKVDGLYGNYGLTWARKFPGYTATELQTLPRVTTETGCTIAGQVTEEIHALNLLSMYLDQFKRGWSHTAVYLLRDRTDEGGNQSFGFFKPDYTPRKAGVYLHNLTTILGDNRTLASAGQLDYSSPKNRMDMGPRCWFWCDEVRGPLVSACLWAGIASGNAPTRVPILMQALGIQCLFMDAGGEPDLTKRLVLALNGLEAYQPPILPKTKLLKSRLYNIGAGLNWDGERAKWRRLRAAAVLFVADARRRADHWLHPEGRIYPLIKCNRAEYPDRCQRFLELAEGVIEMAAQIPDGTDKKTVSPSVLSHAIRGQICPHPPPRAPPSDLHRSRGQPGEILDGHFLNLHEVAGTTRRTGAEDSMKASKTTLASPNATPDWPRAY